jgi:hypothetical protein
MNSQTEVCATTRMRNMKGKFLILIAGAVAAILLAGGIVLMRRNSSSKPPLKTQRYPHQHLPASEWEPTAKLTAVSYKLREGESLAKIATLRYGHQNYYHVVKLYNHIENEAGVAAGATLRVPDIATILNDEGFTRVAASEVELILCSRAKYDKVKGPLWNLRRDRPSRERLVIPQNIKQELLEAADDLQQATESLKAPRPGTSRPPLKMIGQLESAMGGMRELAEGSNDGYGYDIDMVQQRYALGLTYGIIWAREDFK